MPKGLLSATISPELLLELHKLKEEKGVNVSRVVEEALQAYFQRKQQGGPMRPKDVEADRQ